MLLQQAQGIVGEVAETHGVQLARAVVFRAHAEDVPEIEPERAGEVGLEIGRRQGSGNPLWPANGGDGQDGPRRRGGRGASRAGRSKSNSRARGSSATGQPSCRREGSCGSWWPRGGCTEPHAAGGRDSQQRARQEKIARQAVAVARQARPRAQGVGRKASPRRVSGTMPSAHVPQQRCRAVSHCVSSHRWLPAGVGLGKTIRGPAPLAAARRFRPPPA